MSQKPLDTSDKALVHQSNGSPLPVPNAGSHDVSASKASRGSDAETASKSIETHRNSKTLKVDDSRSQRSQSDELAMQAGTEISSRKTSDDKKEIQKSFFSRPFSLSPAVFSSISRLRSVRKKKKNKKGIKDTQRSDKSVKKKKRRARKRTPKPKHSTSHKSASGTGLTQTDKKERSPSQNAFDTTQVAHWTWLAFGFELGFGLGLCCSERCFMRDVNTTRYTCIIKCFERVRYSLLRCADAPPRCQFCNGGHCDRRS